MKYIFIIVAFIFSTQIVAQQMPAFANSYANRLIYNPAQAYTDASQVDIMVLNRNQWVGLDGAPAVTFAFAQLGYPSKNAGVSAYFMNDEAGPFTVSRFNLNYSYKLTLSKSQYLAVGLASSVSHNRLGLSSLELNQGGDQLFANDAASGTNINFGFGLHWKSKAFSFDLAVPRLLKNRLFSAQALGEDDQSKEINTYFFAGRYDYQISKTIRIKPSIVVRVVAENPLSVDLSTNVILKEKFEIAPFIRFKESIGIQASYFITQPLYVGYSYETGTSRLRNFNSGSHEFFVGSRQAIDTKKKGTESKKANKE